jgi:lipoprotein-anchoring transpeptidase ErfK/SrfK
MAQYPAPQARRTRREKRDKTTWILAGMGGCAILVFVLPVMVFLGFYVYFELTGRIYPAVKAGSLPLGWMTQDQAFERIETYWNQNHEIVVTEGERAWKASTMDFGLYVDAKTTVEQAYRIGRGGGGFFDFWKILFGGGIEVEPVVLFVPDLARKQLEGWKAVVDQVPQNASLQFQNSQWVAVPGQKGRLINVQATLDGMTADPIKIMKENQFSLVMQTAEPILPDLSPFLPQLQNTLTHPLVLRAYDPIKDEVLKWTVPNERLASWLRFVVNGEKLEIQVDTPSIEQFLAEKRSEIGEGRKVVLNTEVENIQNLWQAGKTIPGIVYYEPTEYVVQSGDTLTAIGIKVGMPYWKIKDANPDISPEMLMAGQKLVIPSKNDMLPLPVVMNKRIVISITQQRMWVYQDKKQIKEWVVSTGISTSPTMPGYYQVRTHVLDAYASVWDLHMPHFLGVYEGWPGFMNGIHGLPTLSSGQRLWANVLGSPASYGCIILNLKEAEELYDWAEDGVVVEIQP